VEPANPASSCILSGNPLVIPVLPAALGYWAFLEVTARTVTAQRLRSSDPLAMVPRLVHGYKLMRDRQVTA
jgi:hypothetical protein